MNMLLGVVFPFESLDILQALVIIGVMLLPIFFSSFVCRFRSWIAGLFNFIALLAILNFVLHLDALKDFFGKTDGYMPYVTYGLTLVTHPIDVVNTIICEFIKTSLSSVSLPQIVVDIINNEITYLCLWVILALIAFLVFKKRRKKRHEFDDYDE